MVLTLFLYICAIASAASIDFAIADGEIDSKPIYYKMVALLFSCVFAWASRMGKQLLLWSRSSSFLLKQQFLYGANYSDVWYLSGSTKDY